MGARMGLEVQAPALLSLDEAAAWCHITWER